MKLYHKHLIFLFLMGCFVSCMEKRHSAVYHISSNGTDTFCVRLMDWNVCGAFSPAYDSLITDSFVSHPHQYVHLQNPDTTIVYWYNGVCHPLYNQLDLREVYHIEPRDSSHTLKEKITYLYCDIVSDKALDAYVEVKKSMKCIQFLNGDTLHRREIQGLNIYPFHLKKGHNTYLVKAIAKGDDYSFEATIYDSLSVGRLYVEGQSNNIVYPFIDHGDKVITLSNAHHRVLNAPVILQFYDVFGDVVGKSISLLPDSCSYPIPELKKDVSYMCSMTMCGITVRQPILCGREDDAYNKFYALRQNLPTHHPRINEIDQLLYRLDFLLHHPTRYDGDWWWQFKLAPLTYQLEHLFAHLDSTYGQDESEANVQFITYHSEQDDSLQRYLLVHPNRIKGESPIPLVVMMRPDIENLHHFFSCPQLARQWAINQVQTLSNRYGFIIVMPEMRFYLHGDLTPKAETELKLVIRDVQKHYNIDKSRIYLHANCSGGYRALRMATKNPELFAAIGLYAPVYHINDGNGKSEEHALCNSIKNLKGVPMFIHYDPVDDHNSYSQFASLVEDCKKEGIPLTLSVKRNSGKLYNVLLVGEEALAFFKGEKHPSRK